MNQLYFLIILILVPIILLPCSKNEDELNRDEKVTVQYRVTVSDGYEAVAAFTSANFTIISEDEIEGTWISEVFNIDRNQVTISTVADSDDNNHETSPEGELHVEILLDGKTAKEAMGTGKTISLSVSLGN